MDDELIPQKVPSMCIQSESLYTMCMHACLYVCICAPQFHILEHVGMQDKTWRWPSPRKIEWILTYKENVSKPIHNQSLSCRIRKKPANRLLNELTRLYRPVIKHGNGKSSIGYIQPLSGHLSMWKKAIFQCPIGALLVHPDLPKMICLPSKHWLDLVLGDPNTCL